MKPIKHAKKYAKQFLGVVSAEGAPDAIKELALVNSLIEKSPDVRGVLISPMFGNAERAAAIELLGSKLNLSGNTVKFLNYLSAVKAAAALGQVIRAAVAIYSERMQVAKATVISSVPVDSKYESRLKASLGKLTGREVDIEYAIDPSLLGGVLVKVGSIVYDGSIKGQLRLLKDELVKG